MLDSLCRHCWLPMVLCVPCWDKRHAFFLATHQVDVHRFDIYTLFVNGVVVFGLSCICQSWVRVNVFREKPASQRRCKASPQLLRPVTLNRTAADNKCKDSFGSQGSKTQDFSCHTVFVPRTVLFSTPLSDAFKFI